MMAIKFTGPRGLQEPGFRRAVNFPCDVNLVLWLTFPNRCYFDLFLNLVAGLLSFIFFSRFCKKLQIIRSLSVITQNGIQTKGGG